VHVCAPQRPPSLHLSCLRTQAFAFLSTCLRFVNTAVCLLTPRLESRARSGIAIDGPWPGWHLPIISVLQAHPTFAIRQPTRYRHARGYESGGASLLGTPHSLPQPCCLDVILVESLGHPGSC
jgi:hypothetical protein